MADMTEKRRCTATTKAGGECHGGALPGSDKCAIHSLDAKARHALAVKGGKARGARMKGEARTKRGKPFASPEQLQAAGKVIADLLDSVIPDGRGEPNMLERALGVYLLSRVFAIKSDDRRSLLNLLGQVRPNLARDAQAAQLLDLRRAQATLRQMFEAGRISLEELPPGVLDLNV